MLVGADYFEAEQWRALGYSSRGCHRGKSRGTMEASARALRAVGRARSSRARPAVSRTPLRVSLQVGFRTEDSVVHMFVREDGQVASPFPLRNEFDMSLWAAPEARRTAAAARVLQPPPPPSGDPAAPALRLIFSFLLTRERSSRARSGDSGRPP